jgi:hypothetical protein
MQRLVAEGGGLHVVALQHIRSFGKRSHAVPDPRAVTPPLAPCWAAAGPDDRPSVRATARDVALAATREARTRGSLADAARAPETPSAELMRLLGYLRSTVCRYVRARRGAGVPVERVLPEVKGLVREASALEGSFDSADTLMAQGVRWTIAAYYNEPEPAHVPRFS